MTRPVGLLPDTDITCASPHVKISPPDGGRVVSASQPGDAQLGGGAVPPGLAAFFPEIFAPIRAPKRTPDTFRRYNGEF